MKELILPCTKGVHFTFGGKTYDVQTNGVAMGSPLGPVLSGIFIVELENNLIHLIRTSCLLEKIRRWHDSWLRNFSIE